MEKEKYAGIFSWIPKVFGRSAPLTNKLLGAAALGSAGAAGGTKIFGMMGKRNVAEAMVTLAVQANPVYSTMSSNELKQAVEQLEKSFNMDPVLYAQALDIYRNAKESGKI